jgi:hypothetical protein
MNEEEKEKKLLSLLSARRGEAFWSAQRARILSAAPRRSAPGRAWLLVPAAAALLVAVLVRAPRTPEVQEPPAVTAAFIEYLDLLDVMDVLEALPEGEL